MINDLVIIKNLNRWILFIDYCILRFFSIRCNQFWCARKSQWNFTCQNVAKIKAADPRFKGTFKWEMCLSIEHFQEKQWWRWKEFGMTGWDKRKTGHRTIGGHQRPPAEQPDWQFFCQGPSQSLWKESSIRSHCEPTKTPVPMHKVTGRHTQPDTNTHMLADDPLLSCKRYFCIKDRGDICVSLSFAEKGS